MNPQMITNPQTTERSDDPDSKQRLQTVDETEHRLHRIRRNILRKLELRIAIENWSGWLRCRPPSTL
jgi:hypothetical protein